jgi:hypothetical protein
VSCSAASRANPSPDRPEHGETRRQQRDQRHAPRAQQRVDDSCDQRDHQRHDARRLALELAPGDGEVDRIADQVEAEAIRLEGRERGAQRGHDRRGSVAVGDASCTTIAPTRPSRGEIALPQLVDERTLP